MAFFFFFSMVFERERERDGALHQECPVTWGQWEAVDTSGQGRVSGALIPHIQHFGNH